MVELEYAKALFDLAAEKNKILVFEEYLEIVTNTINAEKEFYKLLSSPLIEKEQKKEIINKVYDKLDLLFLQFLYVLVDNERLNLLEGISKEYHKMVENQQSILNVEVVSASKLTKDKLERILKQMERKYPQKKILINNIVNPSILHGVQITCNGESIDLSLKNRFNQMKDAL